MRTATLPRNPADGLKARPRKKTASRGVVQFSKILVPIDFSESSLRALEFAFPLIKHFGSQLHLAHVFEPDYPLASMAAMPLVVPELEVGKRVRRHLKDIAEKYSIELRPENLHAVRGCPFEEICRLARDRDIDLVVISTRGNSGLKHLALGSTAERVVRYSPCPVLVLHESPRDQGAGSNGISRPQFSLKKILVPIDFSNCSLKALAYAKALARQYKSKLILLNSVALQYYVASDEYARYDFPLLMQQMEKAAREQMCDLVSKTDWEDIEVEASIEVGHAGDQICSNAKKHGADLIVTSTHGRTGLKHVLLGSTAEYVVRHAQCPVLVVPDRQQVRSNPKTR